MLGEAFLKQLDVPVVVPGKLAGKILFTRSGNLQKLRKQNLCAI
jgi:hypothetical protein